MKSSTLIIDAMGTVLARDGEVFMGTHEGRSNPGGLPTGNAYVGDLRWGDSGAHCSLPFAVVEHIPAATDDLPSADMVVCLN